MSAKISADDTTTFFRWKRDVASRLAPATQQQLETTLQEIRFDVMFRQEASGRDAIEGAVCRRLNNLSVKDALLIGAQLKWRRLAGEHEDLQRVTNANAHLITKPGATAAAADLELIRTQHQQRLAALTQDVAAAEKEILALGGKVTALKSGVPATAPIATSRAEAQQQMADMLAGRRAAIRLGQGHWPIKIDWDGRQLDETKRAEFLKQQATGALQKRVVIPVRIKGHWLLFEGPNQAPTLPDDVLAKLTAAEVAAFKHDWLEVEAERWAREVAADLPEPAAATGEK